MKNYKDYAKVDLIQQIARFTIPSSGRLDPEWSLNTTWLPDPAKPAIAKNWLLGQHEGFCR
jgi:hypothetical protein